MVIFFSPRSSIVDPHQTDKFYILAQYKAAIPTKIVSYTSWAHMVYVNHKKLPKKSKAILFLVIAIMANNLFKFFIDKAHMQILQLRWLCFSLASELLIQLCSILASCFIQIFYIPNISCTDVIWCCIF